MEDKRFNIRNFTRDERKRLAFSNHGAMMVTFEKEIRKSSENSSIWTPFKTEQLKGVNNSAIFKVHEGTIIEIKKTPKFNTEFMVLDTDTVSALFDTSFNGKVGVLNFASYKTPGGRYIEGSSAQEESLCHSSFLYNVLCLHKEDFYKRHFKTLNRSLYTSELLYTPDITFVDRYVLQDWNEPLHVKLKSVEFKDADVLTIAAPNIMSNTRWNTGIWNTDVGKNDNSYGINPDGSLMNEEQYRELLTERIKLILDVAIAKEDFNLILGAFGCGVFRNNPYIVSSIFHDLLWGEYENVFNKVVFAVPKGVDETNFNVFWNTII